MKAKHAKRIRFTIHMVRAMQSKLKTTALFLETLHGVQKWSRELEAKVIDRELDRFVFGKQKNWKKGTK